MEKNNLRCGHIYCNSANCHVRNSVIVTQALIQIQHDDVEHLPCVQRHHGLCSMSSRRVFNVITPRVQCHHAGSGSALAPPLTCVMCCRELTSTRATVGMKIWNTIIIFICFAQKLFWCLHKITVEPLMLHGLFYQSPCYVSGHGNFSVVLLSMEVLRVLRFKLKYINLCSDNEQRS